MSRTPIILETMQILELFAHQYTQIDGHSPDFPITTCETLANQLEDLFSFERAPHEHRLVYSERAARAERALFWSIYSHIISTQKTLGLPQVSMSEVQTKFDLLRNNLFDSQPKFAEEVWLIAGKDQTQLFVKLLEALGPKAALVKAHFDDYPTATNRFLITYWPNFNHLDFSKQQHALEKTAHYFNLLIVIIRDAFDPRKKSAEFTHGNTAATVLEKVLSSCPALLLPGGKPKIFYAAFASEALGKRFVEACQQKGDSDLILFLHEIIGLTLAEIQKSFRKPLSPNITALLQLKEDEASERRKIEREYSQASDDLTREATALNSQKSRELETFHTALSEALQSCYHTEGSDTTPAYIEKINAVLNIAKEGFTVTLCRQNFFGAACSYDTYLKKAIDELRTVYTEFQQTASTEPANTNIIECTDKIRILLETHEPQPTPLQPMNF